MKKQKNLLNKIQICYEKYRSNFFKIVSSLFIKCLEATEVLIKAGTPVKNTIKSVIIGNFGVQVLMYLFIL